MDMETKHLLEESQSWVQEQLKGSVAFWLEHGMDKENGGIYTCLDRKGEIYSTDKSVWMQGRCAWTFAYLCAVYGPREEWLAASKSCLDFMEAHCINRAAGNRMYFTVTGDGRRQGDKMLQRLAVFGKRHEKALGDVALSRHTGTAVHDHHLIPSIPLFRPSMPTPRKKPALSCTRPPPSDAPSIGPVGLNYIPNCFIFVPQYVLCSSAQLPTYFLLFPHLSSKIFFSFFLCSFFSGSFRSLSHFFTFCSFKKLAEDFIF